MHASPIPTTMAASTTPSAPPGRDRYPQNVKRTYKSKHALIAYHNRVTKEEPELFVPEGKPRFVLFWDLHGAANGLYNTISIHRILVLLTTNFTLSLPAGA